MAVTSHGNYADYIATRTTRNAGVTKRGGVIACGVGSIVTQVNGVAKVGDDVITQRVGVVGLDAVAITDSGGIKDITCYAGVISD